MTNFWGGASHRAASQIISRSSIGSLGKRVNFVRGGNWDIVLSFFFGERGCKRRFSGWDSWTDNQVRLCDDTWKREG